MYLGGVMRSLYCAILLLLVLPLSGTAKTLVSELEGRTWLCYEASYVEDPTDSILAGDMLAGKYDELMEPVNDRVLNAGYSTSAYWVRFEITNDKGIFAEPCLQLLGPNLNNVEFYDASGFRTYSERGLDHPYRPSEMIGGSYIYDLFIEPNSTKVFYLRAKNNIASLRIPLILWERTAYETMQNRKSMIMGVFLGVLLLIMLVDLIAVIILQEAIYVWYFLYLVAMTITLTHGQALLFEVFWPNNPELNDTVTVIFPIFSMIMLIRFSQVFLNTKLLSPIIHKIGTVGMVVFVVIGISWFFRHHLVTIRPFLMFVYSLTPFVMLIAYWAAGVVGSVKGDNDSRMYLLAFSPLLLLSVGILLRNNGLFPHMTIFEYNIPIGFTCEAIVFSAALAIRVQRVRGEKEQLLLELNTIQAQRFKNVIEAVEAERKRIAIDLHDSLGQLLSTAKLNVSVWGDQVTEEDEENYETSMKLLDQACTEVREISYTMMPSTLIRLGFISALKESAANINMADKITVKLDVNEYSGRLDETKGISLYRICQEILNNAIKYSEAEEITIKITESKDKLFLFIKDNGVGFDTQKLNNSSGIGWSNIFSRISMLSGHIRVFSDQSSGTSVHIDVPL